MTIQRLATLLCQKEGKKKQVSRAQMLEILHCLAVIEAEHQVKHVYDDTCPDGPLQAIEKLSSKLAAKLVRSLGK